MVNTISMDKTKGSRGAVNDNNSDIEIEEDQVDYRIKRNVN